MHSVVEVNAIMGLHLGVFVVITALILKTFLLCNQKHAIETTSLNTKYKEHHITVCAFPPYGRNFLAVCNAHRMNLKEVCIKEKILDNREEVSDSRYFSESFYASKTNSQMDSMNYPSIMKLHPNK